MIHRIKAALVILFLVLPHASFGEAEGDGRQAHGVFTGEIKPVLYVTNVEESAPFYRDVLGFDFQGFSGVDADPYYAEMVVAGVKFGLHEPTSSRQKTMVGRQRLYFRVNELRAHRSRVLAWGEDAGAIKRTEWMDMFIVRDPDGNEIVFAVTDPEHHSINPWNSKGPVAREDSKRQ